MTFNHRFPLTFIQGNMYEHTKFFAARRGVARTLKHSGPTFCDSAEVASASSVTSMPRKGKLGMTRNLKELKANCGTIAPEQADIERCLCQLCPILKLIEDRKPLAFLTT